MGGSLGRDASTSPMAATNRVDLLAGPSLRDGDESARPVPPAAWGPPRGTRASIIDSTTAAAGFGSRTANSLKKAAAFGYASRHAGKLGERSPPRTRPSRRTGARARRVPVGPSHPGRWSRRSPSASGSCRCWSWPSRAGCAARAPAASGRSRCVPRRRRSPPRSARAAANVREPRGDDAEVGPSVVEVVAEALPLPHGDVGAEFARGSQDARATAGRTPGSRALPRRGRRRRARGRVRAHRRRSGAAPRRPRRLRTEAIAATPCEDLGHVPRSPAGRVNASTSAGIDARSTPGPGASHRRSSCGRPPPAPWPRRRARRSRPRGR